MDLDKFSWCVKQGVIEIMVGDKYIYLTKKLFKESIITMDITHAIPVLEIKTSGVVFKIDIPGILEKDLAKEIINMLSID